MNSSASAPMPNTADSTTNAVRPPWRETIGVLRIAALIAASSGTEDTKRRPGLFVLHFAVGNFDDAAFCHRFDEIVQLCVRKTISKQRIDGASKRLQGSRLPRFAFCQVADHRGELFRNRSWIGRSCRIGAI